MPSHAGQTELGHAGRMPDCAMPLWILLLCGEVRECSCFQVSSLYFSCLREQRQRLQPKSSGKMLGTLLAPAPA